MADQQHLDLLQQEVEAWNTWRNKHPEVCPDLSDVDLRNVDLSGVNLSGVNLSGANLSDVILTWTNLRNANLRNANLNTAKPVGSKLWAASKSLGAKPAGADLSNANLSNAELRGANFSYHNLSNTDLRGADLSNTDLKGANLKGADLKGARLIGADFSNATLSNTDLSEARIGGTIFVDVDLRSVKGLETVKHEGPSTIGTNTLERSQGDIPEIFLRNAGLSETFIDYIRALVSSPIEYYTCFISYSSRDQDFAEQLYANLHSKGVRCWFAPEEMKTGDKIRQRIDESIRLYDKLLLVLSQHSIRSAWVEFEVEAALAKEENRNIPVLFPIRLDGAVMESNTSWAAHIKRTRHVTDFSNWKQHDDYLKALTRLLRDLQPDSRP